MREELPLDQNSQISGPRLIEGCDVVASELLQIEDLCFAYGQRRIFEHFSFSTSARRVVLKGPSGCGKTTLLRILFGSLRPNPEARIPAFDSSVLVLQEDALFPWLTGRSNISRFLTIETGAIEAHRLFHTVANFIDQPAYKMSFGQRRAIELFRAILYRPQMLYLDEPFNYLDDARSQDVIAALLDATRSTSRLLMTTHRHDDSLDSLSEVYIFQGESPYSKISRVV